MPLVTVQTVFFSTTKTSTLAFLRYADHFDQISLWAHAHGPLYFGGLKQTLNFLLSLFVY